VAKGEAMIDTPPGYGITCNCGMRISGTNENGVISLMKRHLETGKYHTAYLLHNGFEPGDSELEKVITNATSMKKGL
jgi:hypothetical protein